MPHPEEYQKYAEILVEWGYASSWDESPPWTPPYVRVVKTNHSVPANPFVDSLESIHQAHAIEDWLRQSSDGHGLWEKWINYDDDKEMSCHEWRLEKIRWCVIQLIIMENQGG